MGGRPFGVMVLAAAAFLVQVEMADMAQGQGDGGRIELQRSGGLAGGVRRPPVGVQENALAEDDRRDLDRLLAAADFFHQPERFAQSGFPDAMEFRLTVERANGRHSVVFRDGDGHPPQLDDLADWVKRHGAK